MEAEKKGVQHLIALIPILPDLCWTKEGRLPLPDEKELVDSLQVVFVGRRRVNIALSRHISFRYTTR